MTTLPERDDAREYHALFCEECAARYDVFATSEEAARRTAPLRRCGGCARLTCLVCWPLGSKLCTTCAHRIPPQLRLPGPRRVTAEETREPSADAEAQDVEIPNHPPPWRHRDIVTAVAAQTLVVLLVVSAAGGLLPPTGLLPGADPVPPTGAEPFDAAPAAIEASPPRVPVLGSAFAPSAERIDTTAERLLVWEDAFGEVRLQVVATARNRSASLVSLTAASSRWTVVDGDGDEVARGRFAHSFPPVVPPDGTVLLIDALSVSLARPNELGALRIELAAESVRPSTGSVPLDVANISWSLGQAGLSVTAQVSNGSDVAIENANVGVVLRDANGEILSAAYNVAVGALRAGESRTVVMAYPGSPPVDPDLVTSVEASASGER